MCQHICNSRTDPTNTAGARRKAFAEIRKRKQAALKDIRAYVERIPYTVKEIEQTPIVNRRVYLFELQDRDIYRDIREILEKWFGTAGDTPPTRWFMDAQINEVVTRATTQEAQRINQLSGAVGISDPYQIERILMSPEFAERIRRVRSRVFEEMSGFVGDTANDLARTLADGMASGKGIRTITGELTARFDIDESRAQKIARTELATAHRGARAEQSKDARDNLGLRTMVQLISALAPTTRPEHAALHLRIVEIEDVEPLYADTPGQRINCLCTEQTVLIAEDGTIVGQRSMTERDRREVERLTS